MKMFQKFLYKYKIMNYFQLGFQPRMWDTSSQPLNNYTSTNFLSVNYQEIKNESDINNCSWFSKILEPYSYICQFPGEQKPQRITHAFNYWLKIPDDKLLAVNDIERKLHNAVLLIDDIQDDSKKRRGIPVAHSIYGVPCTLNSAILFIFLSLKKVSHLNHPDIIFMCIKSLINLYMGQGIELYWRDNHICPSEEDYREMVMLKNAEIPMIIGLMELFSKHGGDFGKLTTILCIYIQIRNDYNNLFVEKYAESKGSYFEDITEGKFSFPIIHAIQSYPDDKRIINILQQRTKDPEIMKYCVSLLESFGSFEYTRKVLMELDLDARKEIKRFGGNPLLETFLDQMK